MRLTRPSPVIFMTDNKINWVLCANAPEEGPNGLVAFATQLGIDLFTAKLLWNREIKEIETARRFLTPSLHDLPRPGQMRGLQHAAALLGDAIVSHVPISVFGDFDIDGMSAASLLIDFFQQAGATTSWFIPSRLIDGYGLSKKGINSLDEKNKQHRNGPGILVTVDCGISNHEEVLFAKSIGFSVIITDHHQPPSTLPEADAVVNPLQEGCDFPCKNLSGAGVAFYLAAAVRNNLDTREWWGNNTNKRPILKHSLDLVAMGTVGDNMKVTGANRIMVAAGLKTLASTTRPGIRSLLRMSKMNGTSISTEDVAYCLAPRLNAAGRMGCEHTAMQLLLEEKSNNTEKLAAVLDKANSERQEIEKKVMSEALPLAATQIQEGCQGIVLCGDWHKGVAGIVASRLNKTFHAPVIVFTEERRAKTLRGSARSDNTINLVDVFSKISHYVAVEAFGGHAQAAGIELKKSNFNMFAEYFQQLIKEQQSDMPTHDAVMVDMMISPKDIFHKNRHVAYQVLGPFGRGNPEPLFLAKNFQAKKAWVVHEKHLKVQCPGDGYLIQGIGFNMAEYYDRIVSGPVDLTYRPRRNYFKGREAWEIQLYHIFS